MAHKIPYRSFFEEEFKKDEIFFSLDSLNIAYASSAFRKYGVIVIETNSLNHAAQAAFDGLYSQHNQNRIIDKVNGVNFFLDRKIHQDLLSVEANPNILRLISEVLIENPADPPRIPAILGAKLLVKDKSYSGDVFLHQDSCYQFGRRKVTAFFPLCDLRYGALKASTIKILIGTHRFGHLGDAGEIDRSTLEDAWPEFEMAVKKHTYVLMDPHCWHYSNSADLTEEVRGVYTFTYAESNPFCLRSPGCEDIMNANNFIKNKIFKRSRVSKIVELQNTLEKLKYNSNL